MATDVRWLGRIGFAAALELQESLVRQRQNGEIPDTILLLEHDPVYTIGRTRDRSSLSDDTVEVVEINRGGQATYHGPGQLVGYLIVDLARYLKDLHQYLRALEEALIASCAELGIQSSRREGLTGVWVESRKIASIGVGVRKWVTMHGFAINVAADLTGFDRIVPCGIAGVEMTSVSRESGQAVSVENFGQLTVPQLLAALEGLRRG